MNGARLPIASESDGLAERRLVQIKAVEFERGSDCGSRRDERLVAIGKLSRDAARGTEDVETTWLAGTLAQKRRQLVARRVEPVAERTDRRQAEEAGIEPAAERAAAGWLAAVDVIGKAKAARMIQPFPRKIAAAERGIQRQGEHTPAPQQRHRKRRRLPRAVVERRRRTVGHSLR